MQRERHGIDRLHRWASGPSGPSRDRGSVRRDRDRGVNGSENASSETPRAANNPVRALAIHVSSLTKKAVEYRPPGALTQDSTGLGPRLSCRMTTRPAIVLPSTVPSPYNWHRGGIGSTLPISRLSLTGNNLLRIRSYSACVIPEAASFRRTACAHSSSILKYRATAFVPTSKGCASPGWRSFSILSLVAAPLNWD